MRRFFTSDLHFYHANVIRYCSRPYSSVEHMNEMMILNWNSVVSPEDIVYCLGDFSLAARPVESFTQRLNGKKILVLGNHDFPHPAHQKGRKERLREEWTQKYLSWGWDSLHLEVIDQIGEIPIRMCHLPYLDSCPEDVHKGGKTRYDNHRPKDDGLLLLCGHVHEKWKHRFTKKGTLMVNVGVDVWSMKPVSEEELCDYVRSVSSSR